MEDKGSVIALIAILGIVILIVGGIWFFAEQQKCNSSCDHYPCKYSICKFKLSSIGFKCDYRVIGNCCGNGYCESSETQCSCAMDCKPCAGIAGKCKEYFCIENKTCATYFLDNCCGNNVCEIDESFERCPGDCKVQNVTVYGYQGPMQFYKNDCDNILFIKCPQGKYDGFTSDHMLKLFYSLNSYGFTVAKKLSSFYFYAKRGPRFNGENDKTVIVELYVNQYYAGEIEIRPTLWESQTYGFEWYRINFPTKLLKAGGNTFDLINNDWLGIAKYNSSYMTYLSLTDE